MKKKLSLKKIVTTGIALSVFTTISLVFAHEWMAPKTAAEIKNPVPQNEETITSGKELFLDNCAACHGDNGRGLSAEETGLEKSTPNLGKRLKSHSDGDFFWKIQNGRGEMPSFKDDLTDKEIWEIIHFIRGDM